MHWSVITPDHITYPGSMWGDNPEPPEYGADWICVEADTAREAKIKAVREWRRQNTNWMQDARSDNANPFTGLKAEKMECIHGFCFCDIEDCIQPNPEWVFEDECPICYAERQLTCEHEFYSPIDIQCWKCDATRGQINALQNTI